MTKEQKYDAVNKTESLDELADVILLFADENGMIQGRTRKFHALTYSLTCREFEMPYMHNYLTREFGIRQQAIMLSFYRDIEQRRNA